MIKSYEEQIKEGKEKAKDENAIRYYFWDWCLPYGWRQIGNTEGYKSLKELKADCNFYFNDSKNWKILEAKEISRK